MRAAETQKVPRAVKNFQGRPPLHGILCFLIPSAPRRKRSIRSLVALIVNPRANVNPAAKHTYMMHLREQSLPAKPYYATRLSPTTSMF
jgi:hypothetical protein